MEQELRINELFTFDLKDCREESIAKEQGNEGNTELETTAGKKRTSSVPTKGTRGMRKQPTTSVPTKGTHGMRKQPTTCNGCQETFQSSLGYSGIFILM